MKSLGKIALLGLVLSLSTLSLTAQGYKEDDPKHENHYDVKMIDTPELTIEFSGAHSQQAFTMIKLKITNKTNDYILYNTKETVFKYAHGDVQVKGAGMFKGSSILIEPKGKESVQLKVSGGNTFHVKDLKLDLKGFNRVSSKGKVFTAPDFQLPAANNSFETGPFECVLNKSVQKTAETKAEFDCTYKGDQVAIVDPSKASITSSKLTQKYANDNKKDKTEILFPNENYKFDLIVHIPGKVLDMQFATLQVQWNGTFTESTATKLNVGVAEFQFNQETTTLKNQ